MEEHRIRGYEVGPDQKTTITTIANLLQVWITSVDRSVCLSKQTSCRAARAWPLQATLRCLCLMVWSTCLGLCPLGFQILLPLPLLAQTKAT